jgi:UDP-N-acetylmuramyl pentapeptide phosphotransferase/UDP-N-acetylglucosamine-1-phosphate transferase
VVDWDYQLINLLDNMDGLATGVSCIAAGLLGVFLWKSQTFFFYRLTWHLLELAWLPGV